MTSCISPIITFTTVNHYLFLSASMVGPMSCTSLYSNYLMLWLVHLRRHAYKVLPDEASSLKKHSHFKTIENVLNILIISQDKIQILMLNIFIKIAMFVLFFFKRNYLLTLDCFHRLNYWAFQGPLLKGDISKNIWVRI